MKRIIRWLDVNFEPVMMIALYLSLFLIITVQVILRFAFKSGFNWGEEVAKILFVWLSFVSFGYLTRNNRHVRVSFFRERFQEKTQKIIILLCDVIFLIFVSYGFKAALKLCLQTAKFEDKLVTIPVTSNVLYAAGLVGFLLMIIRCVQIVWWRIKNWNENLEKFENYDGKYYTNKDICFCQQMKNNEDCFPGHDVEIKQEVNQ